MTRFCGMRRGDNFTIEGFGIGSRGQLTIDGVNPKTRRKCWPVKEALFTLGMEIVGDGMRVATAILPKKPNVEVEAPLTAPRKVKNER